MNNIYNDLLSFIDDEENKMKDLQEWKFCERKEDIKLILYIIQYISKNHRRLPNFFFKIEKILSFFDEIIKHHFRNIDIFQIFDDNNRILLYFLNKKIIIINESIFEWKKNKNWNKFSAFIEYFYPETKNYLMKFENDIFENAYSENSRNFDEYRLIGENHSYICKLIREDLVEDFITYVNQTNISLSSYVPRSIFETNSYLLSQKDVQLIEYAAFFGSIQIFVFLKMRGVKLTPAIWPYAIHGRNADLIHILEDSKVAPNDHSYLSIYKESVKCHHNEIANYIDNIYLSDEIKFLAKKDIQSYGFHYYNFEFIPNELNRSDLFYLIKYDYIALTKFVMDDQNIDLNSKINDMTLKRIAAMRNNFDLFNYFFSLEISDIKNEEFNKMKKLTEINVPSNVKSIGYKAFAECPRLAKITLPSTLVKIGHEAFYNCESLTEIEIPSRITSISYLSFSRCSSLTNISLPHSLKSIKESAFSGCSSLKQISIPSSVCEIKSLAFHDCSSLTEISIPPQVKSIENATFSRCSSLEKITIPNSVTKIGNMAFASCESLKIVHIPLLVTEIGYKAFSNCFSLESITMTNSVTKIGASAFFKCESLKQFIFPLFVKSIEKYTFYKCPSLCHVSISSSVTRIDEKAFYGCSSLSKILIPYTVKTIDEYAFENCSPLLLILKENIFKNDHYNRSGREFFNKNSLF